MQRGGRHKVIIWLIIRMPVQTELSGQWGQ